MTSPSQFSSDLQLAIAAAVKAGGEIMKVYGKDLGTQYKKDDSPVTIADNRAQKVILEALKPTNLPVLSEEMQIPSFEIRNIWNRYWLVDPLDGTKEFVNGGKDFTVNIALMEHNRPVEGIIFIPFTRELYIGGHSFKQVFKAKLMDFDEGVVEHINLKPVTPPRRGNIIRIAVSASHLSGETLAFVESLRTRYGADAVELCKRGSSVKFCLLAEGKVDMYPRYSPCMEWDTAAGQAICEAAGAVMKRLDDRKPLKYNKKDLVNPPFIMEVPF
ncbi:3'(2'),5'-bisphosphate nucleotidase CysQ [Robertkochia flava]|uniref:3'(2'),5'-bisphosphate nucleotidase CysQ n=1 Tax=Robertkochia flava TaxID=3447986 RepID=UPI001CCDF5FF|nr:3'(2'),5'-bisphosphate nucleotidase CysQ [Robertkochia marina]